MKPPPSTSATGRRRAAAGARTAAASAAKALLDLRHQPGVRVEELLLRLRPAAEYRNLTNAFAVSLFLLFVVTASGLSIRIVAFGMLKKTGWPLRCASS